MSLTPKQIDKITNGIGVAVGVFGAGVMMTDAVPQNVQTFVVLGALAATNYLTGKGIPTVGELMRGIQDLPKGDKF